MRQNSKVLIVDDDAGVRRMLARSLEAEGYAVALAADGGAALVEIERSAPDLILLDVTMPGMETSSRITSGDERSISTSAPPPSEASATA